MINIIVPSLSKATEDNWSAVNLTVLVFTSVIWPFSKPKPLIIVNSGLELATKS
jgi:hypothetical protein